MALLYTLKSDSGEHDVLSFIHFLNESGTERTSPSYDMHIVPEITHFISGEGAYIIEDKEYEIHPGDIFLIRSNEKHSLFRLRGSYEVENIRFDPVFIWRSGDNFDLSYLKIFNTADDNFCARLDGTNPACDRIRACLSNINREFHTQNYGFSDMIKMNLYMILIHLVRDFGYGQGDSPDIREPHMAAIRKTMRYIDAHLNEKLTLPKLAAIANFSTNYYGNVFKQLNGITVVDYIRFMRVQKAINLLPNFPGTMLELANACGFNNATNFNRAFKEHTGQVPSRYVPPLSYDEENV